MVYIFFPVFIYWNVQGIFWYRDNKRYTPKCTNEEMTMVVFFWIFVSNTIILVYLLTVCALLYDKFFGVRRNVRSEPNSDYDEVPDAEQI
jgi:hypothetical protein